jgi:hypothetical protein
MKARPARSASARLALLILAWTVLNLLFNVRYPERTSPALAFLPSLDATVLLAGIALSAWRGYRLPRGMVIALAVAVVAGRAFRVSDGVVWRYFNRPIDLGLDLPTSGEIVRLMRSTIGTPALVAAVSILIALAIGFGFLAAWSMRAAEQVFASSRHRLLFAGAAVLALLLCPLVPPDHRGKASHENRATHARHASQDGRLRLGLYAPSLVPRLIHEARRLFELDAYRQAEAVRVRATAARLQALPHDLGKLRGSHVLLFFIESYGATVLDHPEMAPRIGPLYQAIDAQLGGQGFHIASSLLDSPTNGGRSQLAHQAIFTGIRADNRINDALVQEIKPKTMARFFGEAGYRSVLVMPGNTHRGLYRWVYDFDQLYCSWDLGYRGPAFGFAPMPDQYVVDVIHRRELGAASRPMLVSYALLSSHAPWDPQAPLIEDWSRLGDGRMFWRVPAVRFPINWSNLHEGARAYMHSIAYSLQVVSSYLSGFDLGQALVIIVGDHQPVSDITRGSTSNAVPVHIISRQADLVEVFRRRGYSSSMRPATSPQVLPPGMETFLPNLLVDFSSRPAR